MAVSNRPWSDFTAADYGTPEEYCSASLIDLNPTGQPKSKTRCKLPVREPGGAVNRGAVHAAAAALAGARTSLDAPAEAKRAAARKLVRLYGELKEGAPDSVRRLAGG